MTLTLGSGSERLLSALQVYTTYLYKAVHPIINPRCTCTAMDTDGTWSVSLSRAIRRRMSNTTVASDLQEQLSFNDCVWGEKQVKKPTLAISSVMRVSVISYTRATVLTTG